MTREQALIDSWSAEAKLAVVIETAILSEIKQRDLAKRHALYQQARATQPERWSKDTRKWQPVGPVTLNPERSEAPQKEAA